MYGGRVAVANVVMNRVAAQSWYGDTIEDVCRKPWQFSCWNKDDPNLPMLLALTEDDAAFRECIQVAAAAVNGTLPDLTFDSKHYHNLTVSPDWAEDKTPVIQVGNHLFFNNVR